ncbi:MAG: hypothetical protein ABSA70_00415 [Terriglobia bacterium]
MKNAIEARHVPHLSDAVVQANTGKTWQEWFAVLDAAGAREMDHQSIAAYLYKQLRLPGWWADGDRGLRASARPAREAPETVRLQNQPQQDV